MPRHYRSIPDGAIRIAVPDVTQQTDYSCGAASLQAVAKYYGVGPDEEWEFVRDLRMDHRVGSHPDQIRRAATEYGLMCRDYDPMTIDELRTELDQRHPVLLMIQAWGEEKVNGAWLPRGDYQDDWKDGHWVVAIGYAPGAVFFEDPSLQAVRGYLLDEQLDRRWHDTAREGRHMDHYGLAMWHPQVNDSAYATRAELMG